MDIYQNINDGVYQNKMHYPGPTPKRPKELGKGYEVADRVATIVYRNFLAEFNRDKREWDREQTERYENFRRDALEYCGLTSHPKAGRLFTYAWDHGHSAGYHEVVGWLEDIAEILQD